MTAYRIPYKLIHWQDTKEQELCGVCGSLADFDWKFRVSAIHINHGVFPVDVFRHIYIFSCLGIPLLGSNCAGVNGIYYGVRWSSCTGIRLRLRAKRARSSCALVTFLRCWRIETMPRSRATGMWLCCSINNKITSYVGSNYRTRESWCHPVRIASWTTRWFLLITTRKVDWSLSLSRVLQYILVYSTTRWYATILARIEKTLIIVQKSKFCCPRSGLFVCTVPTWKSVLLRS